MMLGVMILPTKKGLVNVMMTTESILMHVGEKMLKVLRKRNVMLERLPLEKGLAGITSGYNRENLPKEIGV